MVRNGPGEPAASGRRDFRRSRAMQERLHEVVPGGAHTYARGSDQYPEGMAPVLDRGRGAHVWDVDGNGFVEYGMGLRAVTLGHAYPPVLEAARAAMADGMSFTRPTTMELAAAEDFLRLVPRAEMVKFTKNGSDATTAAIRLARAATGRNRIAICSDHPFFSTDDWFMATRPMNAGIPDTAAAMSVGFRYNDPESLRQVLQHPGDVAAVVMEPASSAAEPAPGYLALVRELCDAHGAILIFDEMITGLRWAAGGAQTLYGVTPDLSAWGKALGNGFPISALAGRRELMELGGLRTGAARAFLLSTTHGPETASLAAFRAVASTYRDGNAQRAMPIEVMRSMGERLARGVREVVATHGVAGHIGLVGPAQNLVFVTRGPDGQPSQEFRTLFLAELLNHGVLGQSFVISAAHTVSDVDRTVEAVAAAAAVYRRALDAGSTDGLLQGRPVAPALRSHAAPRQLADDRA